MKIDKIVLEQQIVLKKDTDNTAYPYALPLGRKDLEDPNLVHHYLQVAKPLYTEIEPMGDGQYMLPNPLLDAWINKSDSKRLWLRKGYGTVFYVLVDIPFGKSLIEVTNADEAQHILSFSVVKPEAVCQGVLVSMLTYIERDKAGRRLPEPRRIPLQFAWETKVKRKVEKGSATFNADGSIIADKSKGSK